MVHAILRAIRDETAELFPDPTSRRIHLLKRFAPWALRRLARGRKK